jgi:hypothetical protein
MSVFELATATSADIPDMIRVYNATLLPMLNQKVCFPDNPDETIAG